MLTLSRKRNEQVVIQCGEHTLRLWVQEIRGDRTRITFDGPRAFQITRPDAVVKTAREKQP